MFYQTLKQNENIIIKPADKGGAVVVWSRSLYIKEALRQLNSTRHYARLGESSLKRDTRRIHSVLKSEIDSGSEKLVELDGRIRKEIETDLSSLEDQYLSPFFQLPAWRYVLHRDSSIDAKAIV